MNPQQIHQQARQERQKEARRSKGAQQNAGPQPYVPLPANSRDVFYRIFPYQPGQLWWLALPVMLVSIGFTLLLIDGKRYYWLRPYTIGMALVPVVVYFLLRLRKRMLYPAYKNWLNRLGFPVTGWDWLGQTENFPRSLYWNDLLTVQVVLKTSASKETEALAQDILYLFTIAANGCFYSAETAQAGAAGDIRKKWKPAEPLTVEGSADGWVMGCLYKTIEQRLGTLHNSTGHVQAVNLTFSKTVYKIKPRRIPTS
jgi:hypothetical protein